MPKLALSSVERARLKSAVVAHYDFVWRGLRHLGVSPEDSDDIAQEVFEILAPKIGSLGHGAEKAYLFQIVSRVAANYRRRRARRSNVTGDGDVTVVPDPKPTPDSLAESNERRRLLERLLADLPEDLSTVFVLCELERMTLREVSELLEIPLGTATSRLRRARAQLSEALSRCWSTES